MIINKRRLKMAIPAILFLVSGIYFTIQTMMTDLDVKTTVPLIFIYASWAVLCMGWMQYFLVRAKLNEIESNEIELKEMR